jgi:hypothetical protein
MKTQKIYIEITEFDNGDRLYSVGGGTKDNGKVKDFKTPKECLEEIKYRTALTLLEM